MQITTWLVLKCIEKNKRILVLMYIEHTCRWRITPIKLINFPGTEHIMAFFIPMLQFHKGRRASLKHPCATICISFSNIWVNCCWRIVTHFACHWVVRSHWKPVSFSVIIFLSLPFIFLPTSFHDLSFCYLVLSKHEYKLHLICYHLLFLDVHIWLTNPKREKKARISNPEYSGNLY